MSCIPESGGCEKRATDALVAHLNAVEGFRYEHGACLDQNDHTQKQPERLYIDANAGRRLVIERKSVMWPEDYAHQHSKDHDLANAISADLAGIDFQDVYVLQMPTLGTGASKKELRTVGSAVAGTIRSRYASLKAGQILPINSGGLSFGFGIQPIWERNDSDPPKGLCFSWTMDDLSWSRQSEIQDSLGPQIAKIYKACEGKFAGYADHRRLLMLDPHGDVAYNPRRWWNEVFTKFAVPSAIDEI
jgi:hypothetical protein